LVIVGEDVVALDELLRLLLLGKGKWWCNKE